MNAITISSHSAWFVGHSIIMSLSEPVKKDVCNLLTFESGKLESDVNVKATDENAAVKFDILKENSKIYDIGDHDYPAIIRWPNAFLAGPSNVKNKASR